MARQFWILLRILVILASVACPTARGLAGEESPAGGEAESGEIAPGDIHHPLNYDEQWSLHGQGTTVTQVQPSFPSPYAGPNSLSAGFESRTSVTSTFFLGRKLWRGGEVYFNPELSGGTGLSGTHGVAGFPNGEIYRVDTPTPRIYVARLFLEQVFPIGEEAEASVERIEPDKNQLGALFPGRRLTVIAGKFSLNDFFDNNAYSHDPRTQFLNWSLMDDGAWDYAADTRGYSWGFYIEYDEPRWAVRFSSVLEPQQANEMQLDLNVAQAQGNNLEFEYRYEVGAHPGIARVMAYANDAHMGDYQLAIDSPDHDITETRAYRTKYGFGLNIEQELTPALGAFARLGWNDGATETWAFTEVDRTASLGVDLRGASWNRPLDHAGLAAIVNGLSNPHAGYLFVGGLGFMLGDGTLSYAPEEIVETYYLWQVSRYFAATADFQFINNPGYNSARGPVEVASARLHYEF